MKQTTLFDNLSVRYAMIDDMRLKYPVPFLCRIFDVSSSGYYARLGRPLSKHAREEQRLEVEIRAAHTRSRETHGPERLQKELEANGVSMGLVRGMPDQAHTQEIWDTLQTEEEV